jgi:hypothetical protein
MNQMPWASRVVVTGSSATPAGVSATATGGAVDCGVPAGTAPATATIIVKISQTDDLMLSPFCVMDAPRAVKTVSMGTPPK